MVNLKELTKREIIAELHKLGEERCEARLMRQNKDSLIKLYDVLLKMNEVKRIEEECEESSDDTLVQCLILGGLVLVVYLLAGV